MRTGFRMVQGFFLAFLLFFPGMAAPAEKRPWLGPDYWANPLQDWQWSGGRIENRQPGGDRNVFLLTREVSERRGTLEMQVRMGRLEEDQGPAGEGYIGFRFGIRGAMKDYRDSAVRGDGINAGMTADGRLFLGEVLPDAPRVPEPFQDLWLKLTATPDAAGMQIALSVEKKGTPGWSLRREIPAAWLPGGVALVSSSGPIPRTPVAPEARESFGERRGTQRGGGLRFWFRDWQVAGSALDSHPERAWGPILFTLHTLSQKVLRLTAQMAPVEEDREAVRLEIQGPDGGWKQAASSLVQPLSRTASFRISDWDDSRDTPYQVRYKSQVYRGTVRKDPKTKPQIVVAAFTGNNDLGFPHADVVRHVSHFRPDLLFFTGDNIYERVAEYGIQIDPPEMAALDYLRKWYLFGWEYAELLKDIPSVCLPDDHDVYHGNIWGAGGRKADRFGMAGQDSGGFTMPAEWVNMVQRTQTSHMPDPFDPTPVLQGITVYYGHLLYGGLSTAILEDRKWKSAPGVALPQARIVNGWAQNPSYQASRDGDAPGAELLGARQEAFLEKWAADWKGGVWMKTVLSQTLFANVATLPKGTTSDSVTPKLKVMEPGEYPENEEPVADHDSNGWPQTPRTRALRSMRKALALHIAGDQHLGSTIQYGIDEWNDASWAICVPSVANVWPRRWYPREEGRNRKPGAPRNTGEYRDGFGNRITVHAVSNPLAVPFEPKALHQRAPGFGIVVFDRSSRKITLTNWPRWVEVAAPGARPYEGWPIEIHQTDNGLPRSGWHLEAVSAPPGWGLPVLQVLDEDRNEILYTYRLQERTVQPAVRGPGRYTVILSDPDRNQEQTFRSRTAVR